jgi:hypothetical protein
MARIDPESLADDDDTPKPATKPKPAAETETLVGFDQVEVVGVPVDSAVIATLPDRRVRKRVVQRHPGRLKSRLEVAVVAERLVLRLPAPT